MDLESFYAGISANARGVSVALDERDRVTAGHCNRVAILSTELGRQCALSERELKILRIAAGFHDVGKIGIPDSVLKKTTKFSALDWDVMKAHPAKGQRIILAAQLDDSEAIGLAVRHHHERYDGAGYPDGLAGESIPVLARIVAIADAYDAMATTRHYGPPRTHEAILEVLGEQRGRQHDAAIFSRFARVIGQHPELQPSPP